jgi:LPXTG-motif cell wall-anchored protein
MKKLVTVVLGAVCLNLLLMAPAFAGSELPPPAGEVVTPPGADGGTAFTGANVTMWMVLAVALLAVGVALFVAGRRRRAIAE